jgi:hypothetical protein
MGRPRKPVEKLTRVRDNRGYNSTEISNEIQQEILSQFYRIQKMLSSPNIENDIKKYEILIDILLKMNNQAKTFSIKNTPELKVKELIQELKTSKNVSEAIDKLIDIYDNSKDEDLNDIILYKLYHEKDRLNEEQNKRLIIPFLSFKKGNDGFKSDWENNKYQSLLE